MSLTHIIIYAVVQGLAELLPVSSSAHVIAAAKLMREDPSSPQFTLMLVMLHTGTMFAVIIYFWKAWRQTFFQSKDEFIRFATKMMIATAVTVAVGGVLIKAIEHYLAKKHPELPKAEVEMLFKKMDLLAFALAAAGVLILYSAIRDAVAKRTPRKGITTADSVVIGAVQGLCLPFRGFSRSGATISAGMLRGVARLRAEAFSFALAVILTPLAIGREAMRLLKHNADTGSASHIGFADFVPGLQGMVFSFIAGLIALVLLSKLLEKGQWWLFGVYCLAASGGVYWMFLNGY